MVLDLRLQHQQCLDRGGGGGARSAEAGGFLDQSPPSPSVKLHVTCQGQGHARAGSANGNGREQARECCAATG